MKAFTIFIASLFLSLVLAQDCNNPLLKVFNITGLQAPKSGVDLPYCANLQNGTTCCSAATVAGFQDLVNNLTATLQGIAALKDKEINELNNNFTKKFQDAADKIHKFAKDISKLVSINVTIGNTIHDQFNLFQSISQELNDIGDNFNKSFGTYQQDRSTCFSTLLRIQASAWCLACDPNYAKKGVQANGTINPNKKICKAIQKDCTGFTLQSDYFSPLFQAQQVYNRLVNLTSYITNFVKAAKKIVPSIILNGDVYNPVNFIQKSVSLPDQCNTTNCTWLCKSLFSPNFLLNAPLVADGAGLIGGRDIQLDPIGALLANTSNNTIIANGSVICKNCSVIPDVNVSAKIPKWNPDLNVTGLNFNVIPTPTLPSLNFTHYLLSAILPNFTANVSDIFPKNYGVAIPIPTDIFPHVSVTTNTTIPTTTENGEFGENENNAEQENESEIGTVSGSENENNNHENGENENNTEGEKENETETETEIITVGVGESENENQNHESGETSVVVVPVPPNGESESEQINEHTTVTAHTEPVSPPEEHSSTYTVTVPNGGTITVPAGSTVVVPPGTSVTTRPASDSSTQTSTPTTSGPSS